MVVIVNVFLWTVLSTETELLPPWDVYEACFLNLPEVTEEMSASGRVVSDYV